MSAPARRTIVTAVLLAVTAIAAPSAQASISVTRLLQARISPQSAHPRQASSDPTPAPEDKPAGAVPDYVPTGPLVVDNGFRPRADGFSFENYGDTPSHNLTPAVVQRIFGDRVCSSGTGESCVLIPPAEKWMDAENKSMADGHCYGFSVAALRIWKGQLRAPDLGSANTPSLRLEANLPLQETIAESYIYQELPSVLRYDTYPPTPNDMLAILAKDLADRGGESWTLGIFRRDGSGGHAVTPYAIEDRGSGVFNVLVYDNNYPGVTRAITFDTQANTWNYVAQTNPNDPAQVYEGDRTTKSIDIAPTTPGEGKQPCPFCKSSGSGSPGPVGYNTLSLQTKSTTDHAHLVITDGQGHTTGIVGGRVVNTIPGVRVLLPHASENWLEKPEPKYQLPRGMNLTVTIDASALKKPDQEDIDLTGPGYDLALSELKLRPGGRETVALAGNGQRISYRVGRGESPFAAMGYVDRGVAYAFVAKAFRARAGSKFTLGLRPRQRRLVISTEGQVRRGSYGIGFGRQTKRGVQAFAAPAVGLGRGETGTLAYAQLDRRGKSVPLRIRRGRHVRIVRLKR